MDQENTKINETISIPIQSDQQMHSSIWKFELPFFGPPIKDLITFNVPLDSKFLYVDFQDDVIFAWFMVNPEKDKVQGEEFRIVGTGHDAFKVTSWTHAATLQKIGFVWHIFRNS